MTRLIVNADDFGLTPGVNRAILELHRAGVLTSATLMARAPATDEAISIALATPTLGVGCHLVLVDGHPVLPAAQLPTLVDPRTGQFHPTPGAFLKRLFTGRIRAAEIEAEASAQIRMLQGRGLALTHIDTHKHMHLFPAVLRPVLRAARTAGISAIRNPFEPLWSARRTPIAPLRRRIDFRIVRRFAPVFHRLVAQNGLATTHGALGVLATGTLDAATLRALVSSAPNIRPDGAFELVTHPGYNDEALSRIRTRLLASRETERAALLALREIPNLELVSFAALSPLPAPA
ncbi:MAG TPA: ChbG/HpnK family deacetylase [Terracidiphilus sp.]|nr:ChbG/HpnK family deacetylase [Terracidiphilus sp.]